MRCDNCKCIIPDASVNCMYCGYTIATGSTKTVAADKYTRTVKEYGTFPSVAPTKPVSERYNGYNYKAEYGYGCEYQNRGYFDNSYNQNYYNTTGYDAHMNNRYDRAYNPHRYNNNYINTEYNTNYSGYGVVNKSATDTNTMLLYLFAIDTLFLLIMCMLLLLVVL